MEKLKSRKLAVGLIGAIGIILNDLLGSPVSKDAMYSAIAMLGTYILSQGLADFSKEKKLEDLPPFEGEMNEPGEID